MTDSLLPFVDVTTATPHTASVIWLHGLGDSGNGFAPIVSQFRFPSELGIRFIFPHAPIRPVTINNNMPMRAWYDIKSMDFENRADKSGVEVSAEQVKTLIQAEIDAGIPANKIVLAGFSQGGVIALHLANILPFKLAGVLAMSTYLSHAPVQADNVANGQTPIMMMHGSQDDVVPYSLGVHSYQQLQQAGYTINWQEYPMQHNVCPEQINDIAQWLHSRLQG